VGVDGCLEVLGVSEPTGRLLDSLNHGVDALEARIGQAMAQVGEQVRGATLVDELGDSHHGLAPATRCAPEPAGEERPGSAGAPVLRGRAILQCWAAYGGR